VPMFPLWLSVLTVKAFARAGLDRCCQDQLAKVGLNGRISRVMKFIGQLSLI